MAKDALLHHTRICAVVMAVLVFYGSLTWLQIVTPMPLNQQAAPYARCNERLDNRCMVMLLLIPRRLV